MRRKDDGSIFGPVINDPSGVYLAVTPLVYERISLEATQDRLRYMEKNSDILTMKAKIKTFEDNGNIPAMKHWEEKLQQETQYRVYFFKRKAFENFIEKSVADESIKKLYCPGYGGVKLYQSLDEMKEDFENYCNPKIKGCMLEKIYNY